MSLFTKLQEISNEIRFYDEGSFGEKISLYSKLHEI